MLNRLETALGAINSEAKDDSLILFVGAGVSINSGYPSWNSLIENFREELHENSAKKTNQQVAQEYYDNVGKNLYYKKLQEIFGAVKPKDNPILDQIVKIRPKHIITTNYDKLLENSLQNEISQYSIVKDDKDLPYSRDDHNIIKMHGDLDSKNIVLTESDYKDYAKNFESIIVKIRSLLVNHTVLFIGYSLQDDTFNNILDHVNDLFSADAKRAYLYLPEKLSPKTIQSYEKRNIFCFTNIEQNDSDDDPGQLLTNLLKKIRIHPSFRLDDNIVPQDNKNLWKNISFLNHFSFIESHTVARYAKLAPNAYLFWPDTVRWVDQDSKIFEVTNLKDRYGIQITDFITKKTFLNTFLDFKRPENVSDIIANQSPELNEPFNLYLEDKFDQAKILFRKIANEAYSARNYVTYLIAEFNVAHLKLNDLFSSEIDLSPSISNKSLEEVLKELIQQSKSKEDQLLGIYFRDQINNFKFIFEKLFKIFTLSNKIKSEWSIIKKGGASYNANLSMEEFEF
ncbi:SIR2 family protein, partial [Leuconostoc pseudomesenteroides]|uniref:SIR2 family protein n=1 Tax=Leuconostoc pseudomesenteroides TaxID=33968 RepID=UPI0040365E55